MSGRLPEGHLLLSEGDGIRQRVARREADGVNKLGARDDAVGDVSGELRVFDQGLDGGVGGGLVASLRTTRSRVSGQIVC